MPRGGNTGGDSNAEQNDYPDHNPRLGNIQQHRALNQPRDQYQKANHIESK
jgi:hypothetical protein